MRSKLIKYIKYFTTVLLAGAIAIVCLSLIMCIYSLTPVHIDNCHGNTDYVWTPNSMWIKMTEGIAYGRYDDNGFNNINVVDNPDIVILGSSHMEASNVKQDENMAYILAEKIEDKYSVYNMGISGHDLKKTCQYLPDTVKLYEKAPRYMIIETSSVYLTEKDLNQILLHKVEYTKSYTSGIVGIAQRIPFFRCSYEQIEKGLLDLFSCENQHGSDDIDRHNKTCKKLDEDVYINFFNYLKTIEDEYSTQLIFVYHPSEEINKNGSIKFDNGKEVEMFRIHASINGIGFIDLTQPFEKMYEKEHHLPHGFITGEIGTGHLNKWGHEKMAEVIYDEIIRMEGISLCK